MEDVQVLDIGPAAVASDFRDIVDRFGAPAMALALNILGNREDAEDACQEAFIRIFRNLDTVDSGKNFKNWVYTIIYHCALDVLKKKRKARRLFEEIKNESKGFLDHGSASLGKREKLSPEILRRLNPKEKTALSLWANEGYTTVEISEVMRCSSSTARVHLFNARKKIKIFLEKNHA